MVFLDYSCYLKVFREGANSVVLSRPFHIFVLQYDKSLLALIIFRSGILRSASDERRISDSGVARVNKVGWQRREGVWERSPQENFWGHALYFGVERIS